MNGVDCDFIELESMVKSVSGNRTNLAFMNVLSPAQAGFAQRWRVGMEVIALGRCIAFPWSANVRLPNGQQYEGDHCITRMTLVAPCQMRAVLKDNGHYLELEHLPDYETEQKRKERTREYERDYGLEL